MVKDHMWQAENWGYEKMDSPEALLTKYEDFYQEVFRLVENPGLSAVVYTQTTDVETETNGLMTYDRHLVKMGIDNIAKAHAGYLAPRLKSEITQFIDNYLIELSAPADDAKIFYTLNGTDPDETSELYSAPVEIDTNTTLKAIAIWEDGKKSRISAYELEKVEPKPGIMKKMSPGLIYKYFKGAWTNLPDFTKETPLRTGIAEKLDLAPSRNEEYDFGLVFNGYLNVPATGVYVIYLSSDDGGRLLIDGEQVIDYDGIHGMGEKKVAMALEEGFHPLEFQHFQHLGGKGIKVSWESNEIPREEISAKFYGH